MNVKKAICAVAIIALCIPLSASAEFSLSLQAGMFFPGDDGYKEIYGDSHFLPGAKLEVNLTDSLYVWGGFWTLSVAGTTPILQADADSSQNQFAFGAGYAVPFAKESRFSGYIEAGILLIHFKEDALGTTIDGNATGFRVGTGVRYDISTAFFTGAGLAYTRATKELVVLTEDVEIKLGGFSLLIEAGLRF